MPEKYKVDVMRWPPPPTNPDHLARGYRKGKLCKVRRTVRSNSPPGHPERPPNRYPWDNDSVESFHSESVVSEDVRQRGRSPASEAEHERGPNGHYWQAANNRQLSAPKSSRNVTGYKYVDDYGRGPLNPVDNSGWTWPDRSLFGCGTADSSQTCAIERFTPIAVSQDKDSQSVHSRKGDLNNMLYTVSSASGSLNRGVISLKLGMDKPSLSTKTTRIGTQAQKQALEPIPQRLMSVKNTGPSRSSNTLIGNKKELCSAANVTSGHDVSTSEKTILDTVPINLVMARAITSNKTAGLSQHSEELGSLKKATSESSDATFQETASTDANQGPSTEATTLLEDDYRLPSNRMRDKIPMRERNEVFSRHSPASRVSQWIASQRYESEVQQKKGLVYDRERRARHKRTRNSPHRFHDGNEQDETSGHDEKVAGRNHISKADEKESYVRESQRRSQDESRRRRRRRHRSYCCDYCERANDLHCAKCHARSGNSNRSCTTVP